MTKKNIKFFGTGEVENSSALTSRHYILLLWLALTPETGIGRNELAETLWGDKFRQSGPVDARTNLPVDARTNLRRTLSKLRNDGGLKDFLPPAEKGEYDNEPVWLKTRFDAPEENVQIVLEIDVLQFDRLFLEGVKGKEAAIQLYRGRLLDSIENTKADIAAVKEVREKRHENYVSAVRTVAHHTMQENTSVGAVEFVCAEILEKFPNDAQLQLILCELLEKGGHLSTALTIAKKYIEGSRATAPPKELTCLAERLSLRHDPRDNRFEGGELFGKFLANYRLPIDLGREDSNGNGCSQTPHEANETSTDSTPEKISVNDAEEVFSTDAERATTHKRTRNRRMSFAVLLSSLVVIGVSASVHFKRALSSPVEVHVGWVGFNEGTEKTVLTFDGAASF